MRNAILKLNIKSAETLDDGAREIRGIATTGAVDRMGDIVEPLGCTFAESVPLLWQHSHNDPIGRVWFGKPTAKGVPFFARIAKADTPGRFNDLTSMAWNAVKSGVVDCVSIGFRPLNDAVERLASGGLRFREVEIMELSLVSVAAQPEAQILEVRAAAARRAAGGSGKRAGTDQKAKLRFDRIVREVEAQARRKRLGIPEPSRVVRLSSADLAAGAAKVRSAKGAAGLSAAQRRDRGLGVRADGASRAPHRVVKL